MITRQTALAEPKAGEAYRLVDTYDGRRLFSVPVGETAGPRTTDKLAIGLYPWFYAPRPKHWPSLKIEDRIRKDVQDFCAEHSRKEGVVFLPPDKYLDTEFLQKLAGAFFKWKTARLLDRNPTDTEKYPNALFYCQTYWKKPFDGFETMSSAPLEIIAAALNTLERENLTAAAWGKNLNSWGLKKDGKRGRKGSS